MWILAALLSYFLSAIVALGDKFLVNKKIPNPVAYAFFIGFLSVFAVILIPFGWRVPSPAVLLLALASGAVFLFAQLLYFKALFDNEASRVVVFVGALVPVLSLLLGMPILGDKPTSVQLLAFILLLLGSFLISLRKEKLSHHKIDWLLLVSASFLFSLSYILAKLVYLEEPFVSGFIWTRLGSFAAAFLLLIPQANKEAIFRIGKKTTGTTGLLVIGNKTLGGAAFLFLNLAFALGRVGLVNALQGVQYALLFVLALLLSYKFPHILQEEINKNVIAKKILAIVLIAGGLFILTL